ncbi:hypothetical protein SAMN02745123_01963 [Desulforamulus aeronauticus DSM 10349]|uniref:Uncharacterized protein n=1 Tax=Desulforamulus aeronauticus DSM 10349 TaxID=1121421 RepID=A0A1M6SQZ4_9FIRM|nr:hypothetical protein SAMN02745123_01963 [Desulforamulus aeronauticus DSM 10349]
MNISSGSLLLKMMPNLFLIIVLIVVVATVVFKWLWNTTIPQIFGLKEITYWQSLRLLLIAWLLFGHFGN